MSYNIRCNSDGIFNFRLLLLFCVYSIYYLLYVVQFSTLILLDIFTSFLVEEVEQD